MSSGTPKPMALPFKYEERRKSITLLGAGRFARLRAPRFGEAGFAWPVIVAVLGCAAVVGAQFSSGVNLV